MLRLSLIDFSHCPLTHPFLQTTTFTQMTSRLPVLKMSNSVLAFGGTNRSRTDGPHYGEQIYSLPTPPTRLSCQMSDFIVYIQKPAKMMINKPQQHNPLSKRFKEARNIHYQLTGVPFDHTCPEAAMPDHY